MSEYKKKAEMYQTKLHEVLKELGIDPKDMDE